jgi:hypothetical protein
MCPKIDVMERECKNLEFEVHLNRTLVYLRIADSVRARQQLV